MSRDELLESAKKIIFRNQSRAEGDQHVNESLKNLLESLYWFIFSLYVMKIQM